MRNRKGPGSVAALASSGKLEPEESSMDTWATEYFQITKTADVRVFESTQKSLAQRAKKLKDAADAAKPTWLSSKKAAVSDVPPPRSITHPVPIVAPAPAPATNPKFIRPASPGDKGDYRVSVPVRKAVNTNPTALKAQGAALDAAAKR